MPIKIENLIYTYGINTPFEYKALKGINLDINNGDYLAIVGKTGSGKSSLIQHLNAILIPTSGSLKINEYTITNDDKKTSYKPLRKVVGVVFQFSEYQLFEESIIKDVMFGPQNFDVSEEEAHKRAVKYLKLVDIDEDIFEKSPFNLSGGQKRRVAIAGILAMEPDVIVLDEPTAGLDPQGIIEIMSIIETLNKEHNKTIVLVTHDMDVVYDYAKRVILINDGKIMYDDSTLDFFNREDLNKYNIEKPKLLQAYIQCMLTKPTEVIKFEKLIQLIEGVLDNGTTK
ncbi:energy-coupling factor transporter ATPase [Mycoplasma sp. P36-A1]|uniref:energy-coupling factor transporter ATPase n=1 Tax=Mycoplasma sp. P36-A1 TaxID=3252900 RepID=UPI003C2B5D2F